MVQVVVGARVEAGVEVEVGEVGARARVVGAPGGVPPQYILLYQDLCARQVIRRLAIGLAR